jgi:hypothetical protein
MTLGKISTGSDAGKTRDIVSPRRSACLAYANNRLAAATIVRRVWIVTPVTAADSVAAMVARGVSGPPQYGDESMITTISIIFGALALASAIDWAIERADRRRRSEDWRNYRP